MVMILEVCAMKSMASFVTLVNFSQTLLFVKLIASL
uniref:Uncharacterized protein n=1 Tax=Arundo donax TaxID=35708 RepID=A0A0A9FLT0_ARUDO